MIIAIIPARGGSKRIPHKNMIDFCGKPLVQWTIEQAKASKLIDKVYLSSDDLDILELGSNFDIEILYRYKNLSGDDITLEQVGSHVLESIPYKPDTIVYLQPTSPLRLLGDIDNAIRLYLDKKESVFSVNIEDDLFLWGYDLFGRSYAKTFDSSKRKKPKIHHRENGSIYVVPVEFVQDFKRYSFYPFFYIQYKWQGFEIDELEDVEICEYFMKEKILK